jgi:hypothetical protein
MGDGEQLGNASFARIKGGGRGCGQEQRKAGR